MGDIARGQRVPLTGLADDAVLDIGIDVSSADNLSFDISCFGVNASRALLADQWLVFFNNTASPGDAVKALGPHAGDEQVFRVDLTGLPPDLDRLVFTVNLDGDGTMSRIAKGHVRILLGDQEMLRYPYYGADFTDEQSIVVGELYRHSGWRFAAVGQGFAGGLETLIEQFGGSVDDDAPAGDSAPAPVIAPPDVQVDIGEPEPSPVPVAEPEPVVAAPAPAAPVVPEQIGPVLTGRVEYKLLTQTDSFFGGKFDPDKVGAAIGSYATMGWTVVGTATDRLGRSRDSLMVLLEREI